MAEINSSNSPSPVNSPMDVPLKITENPKFFGYTDIITFWTYVKNNNHYIKMHKIANVEHEEFGFIMPLDSDWDVILNEFFEKGFGFTSTKDYYDILEKYLGFEIIDRVTID